MSLVCVLTGAVSGGDLMTLQLARRHAGDGGLL